MAVAEFVFLVCWTPIVVLVLEHFRRPALLLL